MTVDLNDPSTWPRLSAAVRVLAVDDVIAVLRDTVPIQGVGDARAKWMEVVERFCRILSGESERAAFRLACRSGMSFETARQQVKESADG